MYVIYSTKHQSWVTGPNTIGNWNVPITEAIQFETKREAVEFGYKYGFYGPNFTIDLMENFDIKNKNSLRFLLRKLEQGDPNSRIAGNQN